MLCSSAVVQNPLLLALLCLSLHETPALKLSHNRAAGVAWSRPVHRAVSFFALPQTSPHHVISTKEPLKGCRDMSFAPLSSADDCSGWSMAFYFARRALGRQRLIRLSPKACTRDVVRTLYHLLSSERCRLSSYSLSSNRFPYRRVSFRPSPFLSSVFLVPLFVSSPSVTSLVSSLVSSWPASLLVFLLVFFCLFSRLRLACFLASSSPLFFDGVLNAQFIAHCTQVTKCKQSS